MRGVKLIAQWHLSLPGPPPPPPPLPPAFGCDSRGPHNHMGYHLPLPISISLKIINWKQPLFLYYYIYHFPQKRKINLGVLLVGIEAKCIGECIMCKKMNRENDLMSSLYPRHLYVLRFFIPKTHLIISKLKRIKEFVFVFLSFSS